MFIDKIPVDVLRGMLESSGKNAEFDYIKAYEKSGSVFPEEKRIDLVMCASVAQIFFLNMITQIDTYEATELTKSDTLRS